MGYLELDMEISDEAKAIQKEVRKFAMEVMRPIGIELDKLKDPADVIAKNSPLWDVYKAHRELNLHQASIPKELGGMAGDIDPKAGTLVANEMGYGDAGLAISMGAGGMPFNLAALSPDPAVQQIARDYCEDTKGELIGCWAITEPMHGSDWVNATNPKFDDPKCGSEVFAVLKGDEYIVSGQKSAWVSNGTIATHAALHVNLDPSKGMQGTGLAVIPLDLPGITRGKPLDKIGQRALNQGEIFFDEVKIPKSHMLVPDPAVMHVVARQILTGANTGMGQTFVGLAQAAFDEALKYARERIQGGVPIFEHQNIKLRLFEMFTKLEAARALSRRVSLYNAVNEVGSLHYAIASKIFSTQTAYEVADGALTVFGGNGLAREYVVEKMFRDARASMIEDGDNNVLAIGGAEELL
ncbi:MAG: acyl-CoA dehydrogenase family protein [Desulfobacterales bacterium]